MSDIGTQPLQLPPLPIKGLNPSNSLLFLSVPFLMHISKPGNMGLTVDRMAINLIASSLNIVRGSSTSCSVEDNPTSPLADVGLLSPSSASLTSGT